MASSKFLISLRHLISGCSCFFSFLLCFFFLFFERCRCQASAVPKIDPIEARAVNTILARWERTDLWLWGNSGDYPKKNITRDELCSGIAIDDTPVDDINPAIKCDCKFHNGTVCHITLLKLYALNLARGGAFPQELSNLTYLTNLDLGRNFLTGSLPAFIGNLSSLQYLYVDGNSLTGPLPAFIGNLSLLQYLDLSGNSLTGPLPAFIGNLSSLKYMDVSRNSLIGSLPIFIGNLSSLQYLDVSRNSLIGPLAAFIRNLSSLEHLDVGENALTGPLPVFMGNLSSLQWLDVGENVLTGPLPAFMENLSSLEWLNVGGNFLTGPLLAFIGNLSSLQLLILGPNNFSGTLPAELGNLRNLQEWNMISSGLSGELPTSLSNLTAIQILNMSDNNFIGKLPHFIGTWPNLQVLWIQRSSISGPIPSSFFNLTQLYDLNLTHNYLTGSLPAFIGNLSSLKFLDVGTNALSGPIPRELGNLKNLISLGLGPNNFSGTLPAELGGLGNLQQWDMSSSGLSGELPTSLSNLTAMQILMMSDNNFIGKIPYFIGTWSNLKVLMIQGNSISGPIPSSFFNLFNLNDLRIGDLINGSSSLTYIMEMTKLNTLILRNAKICDTLPSDFANFRSLEILDLSFNNITGNIPQSLLSLSSLKFLFLGNNSITGTLPGTKSSTLSNIDLSYNQLSGSFPPWVNDPSMVLNLVANNFFIDNSTSSVLPSGLECLQRDISCYRDSPAYYQFAINCGGGANVTSYDGTNFDIDNADLSATSYFVNNVKNWAVSIAGSFIGALNPKENYIISSQIQSQNTLDSKLFMTARMSPSSLRYYGLGLENGNYTVKLQFSEIGIPDQPTWTSLARRVFDIYIQGMLKEKDFDIRKEAGGKSFTVVLKEYQAPVTNNFLEIHLFWAGKGTTNIPSPGYYGPSISAINVSPYDFIPSVSSKPPHSSSSNRNTALVIGIVCGVVVLGLTVFAILVWKHKQKNPTKDNEDLSGMTAIPNTFSYSELRTATEDFNQSNFLGEGGFGPVFKGKLHDGRMVAVKKLSVASQQGERQFTTEIATISAVQHRNLAKLYGCCIEEDKRLLVYEYLENKSLDQAIFGKNDLHLDWKTRFEICLGVARGLAYLHEESSVRIIHRDVKSSNILLDGNLTPKISDFGLAKLYDDKWTHISTRVAGTIGYLAPEYAMRGHLTEKADVFSFGVVALEVLSGRRNSDPSLEEEQSYLLDWAWHLYEQKHELELVDPSLSSYDTDEATRVIGVSLLCIQASPTLRPAMSAVVAMLAGFIEVNEVTSRPGYLTEWQFKDISSNFASDGLCESTNMRPTNSQVSVPSNADTVNL